MEVSSVESVVLFLADRIEQPFLDGVHLILGPLWLQALGSVLLNLDSLALPRSRKVNLGFYDKGDWLVAPLIVCSWF